MKRMILIALSVIIGMGLISCANFGKPSYLSTQEMINALGLQPMTDDACPGYFLPVYESRIKAHVSKDRSAASLIYYMMTPEVPVDPWHIISSDEIMLYHSGAPMIVMLLLQDGTWKEIVLGPEADNGQVMQYVIPAGTWMGFVKMDVPEVEWGVYGVMVVPGWHIDDIRMVEGGPELAELMKQYPDAVGRGKELGLF